MSLLPGSSLVDPENTPPPFVWRWGEGKAFSVDQQGRQHCWGFSVSRGSIGSLQKVRITLDFQLDKPSFACNCNISKETKHVALFVYCRDVLRFFVFFFTLPNHTLLSLSQYVWEKIVKGYSSLSQITNMASLSHTCTIWQGSLVIWMGLYGTTAGHKSYMHHEWHVQRTATQLHWGEFQNEHYHNKENVRYCSTLV